MIGDYPGTGTHSRQTTVRVSTFWNLTTWNLLVLLVAPTNLFICLQSVIKINFPSTSTFTYLYD